MASKLLLSVLWLCGAAAAFGQTAFPFELSLTQGNSTNDISNGGSVVLNSPGPGQPVTASLVLTYLGTGTAVLNSGPQLLGAPNFTVTPSDSFPLTLSPSQKTTFTIKYVAFSPIGTIPASAQLSLPYLLTGSTNTAGMITVNLAGTTPDLSVSYVFPADGNVISLISGSAILFPDTLLNTNASVTISVANRGNGPGNVDAIHVTGTGFTPLGLPSQPAAVPAGSALQFVIRFTPTKLGPASGSLQMTLGGNAFTAALQGTGIASSFAYSVLTSSGAQPILPGQIISLPDTNVGSKNSLDIMVRNSGSAPGSVTSISFSGTGFAITDGPALPVMLNPNDAFTITVTFAPQQPGAATGKLRFNNDAFNLNANAIGPQLTYSYAIGTAVNTIVPGGAVVLGQQKVGQTSTATFTVQNTGTATANVISIGTALATGSTQSVDVFSVANLPPLPAELAPGKSLTFNVVFAPNTTGLATSNLLVNTDVFLLSGLGSAPVALPAYTFSGGQSSQAPFQQPAIGLSLSAPYPLPLRGALVLTEDTGGLSPDPAVQFATGGQTVAFTIPANSTDAVFANGAKQIRLQTGSVAGTITLTPSFATQAGLDLTPASPPTLQFTVARAAPQLLTAAVTSAATNSFTLSVTGYATTRSVSSFKFQFAASSGVNLSSSSATLDASGASFTWFQSSQSQPFGGQFVVTIPFNIQVSSGIVTSPINSLTSVSVSASNDVGASNTLTATIQ